MLKHIAEVYLVIAFIAFFVISNSHDTTTLPPTTEEAFWQAIVWPATAMKKLEKSD